MNRPAPPLSAPKIVSRLIVIDDDPAIIRLLTHTIGSAFEGEIAADAMTDPAEALRHIEGGCVDILLTDLEMPAINGLELLRFAKQKNPCTQVVFLTGNSTQQALLEALEQGAADYLLKPIDREALVAIVREAHDRGVRWRAALAETWRRSRAAPRTNGPDGGAGPAPPATSPRVGQAETVSRTLPPPPETPQPLRAATVSEIS